MALFQKAEKTINMIVYILSCQVSWVMSVEVARFGLRV